jgi:hypothetical protein
VPRQIIFHGDSFINFYKELDPKVKQKIMHVLDLIKQVERVPEKFLKSFAGSKDL